MKYNWQMRKKQKCNDEDKNEKEEVDDDQVKTIGTTIYFYAEISRQTILKLITELASATKLAQEYNVPFIKLFIHSDGGDLFSGMSAMDHIKNNSVPVHTYCDGFVASAATLLLISGHKRFAAKHSWILIHQLSTEFWGRFADLVDEFQNANGLMNMMKKIYSDNTDIPPKVLAELLTKELNISADRAREYGIISEFY